MLTAPAERATSKAAQIPQTATDAHPPVTGDGVAYCAGTVQLPSPTAATWLPVLDAAAALNIGNDTAVQITCQRCGGHVEGSTCDRQARERRGPLRWISLLENMTGVTLN